ncbi:far upstream element-binding protein 1-like [Babylonia areolata]|uniref:far upstream element-binding protein 1-like n=1 Tax=Babylonia areolata TaxID=304850 RepID=UPI003FD4A170
MYQSRGGGFGRSRGGDDYDDGGSNYEIFVPARDCGKIIGRGGGKIRELQDQSRCRIKVCQDDEGDGTRRVELTGTDDAIDTAKELIHQILEAGDDRGGRQFYGGGGGGGGSSGGGSSSGGGPKEVIQVDSGYVGRIIGKGGSRVRELQDDTGCRINVSRGGGSYGQTDVELIGSRDQIQRAKDAIFDLVNQSY